MLIQHTMLIRNRHSLANINITRQTELWTYELYIPKEVSGSFRELSEASSNGVFRLGGVLGKSVGKNDDETCGFRPNPCSTVVASCWWYRRWVAEDKFFWSAVFGIIVMFTQRPLIDSSEVSVACMARSVVWNSCDDIWKYDTFYQLWCNLPWLRSVWLWIWCNRRIWGFMWRRTRTRGRDT